MDAVKAFNAELSSLYDVKPPISKAKMTALTRGAIKAIKFYKHVVQSVEKFILKCKSEYKVPGLYVIDSIVRQSRHQFGTDKDVFAPRFAKNMQQTFVNLYKCPAEDKSKVIRVLNLWQKNQVFAPDVVQPLFDLADPNHPMHKEVVAMQTTNGMLAQSVAGGGVKGSPALQKSPTKTPSSADPATLAQLGTIANNPYFQSTLDSNTIAQLQSLNRILGRQGEPTTKPEPGGSQVHFDRKLLDFDYGSDEEDGPTNPSPKLLNNSQAMDTVSSLLSNPEVVRQLQTLQQSMTNQNNVHVEFDVEKMRKLQEMKQQEEEFDKHLAQTLPNLPFAAECEFKPNTNSPSLFGSFYSAPPPIVSALVMGPDLSQPPPSYKPAVQTKEENSHESEVEFVGTNDMMEVIDIDHGDSRSPSRERYGRRRRSRSRDRSRDRSRRRRSRSSSRSRTRKHRSSRSRERDREREKEKEKERERERERKKRGLPPIKKDNLSVCSTTLWVGHLSKLVHQEDLSDTFGEFGEIVSIDLIIPRGCAFIVMHRRQDASRCLTKLKNHKMQGKAITLAWAPGKGVKGKDLKDYWEGDLGVSYIPYAKLRLDMDLELLEDGGTIDEDTAPDWMRTKLLCMPSNAAKMNAEVVCEKKPSSVTSTSTGPTFITMPDGTSTLDTSQPPPVPNTNLIPPPPINMPLVPPFPLNSRLLGMPPGMLGVPPPALPSALLQNPLLAAQFGQGLIPPPMAPQMTPKVMDGSAQDGPVTGPPPTPEGLLPFGLLPPHPPPIAALHSAANVPIDEMEMEEGKVDGLLSSNNFNGDGAAPKRRSVGGGSDDDGGHRGRDRRENRGPPRSWGRENRGESREERRDREKALNDRLREMAGDNSFREDKEMAPFPGFNGSDPMVMVPDRFRRHMDDFPPAAPGPEGNMSPVSRYPEYEGPPLEYDAPPHEFEGPPLEFEPPREFERFGPMRGDRFDGDRRRDFFPPRDGFGPPRGMPPRGFRGPPQMEMFNRGGGGGGPMMRPMFRGGRGGPRPWLDRGPPIFNGPPDFFRIGGGPPGHNFDDPNHPLMRNRHDRRRFSGRLQDDFLEDQGGPPPHSEPPPPIRRVNRWSNASPPRECKEDEIKMEEQSRPAINDEYQQPVEEFMIKNEPPSLDASCIVDQQGNTTPLHDEPFEPSSAPPPVAVKVEHIQNVGDVNQTQVVDET